MPDHVGTRIRSARRGVGLTQVQLAEKLGVESITVSRWERGVTSPSLPRLRKIAEITETPAADLVRSEEELPTVLAEIAALRRDVADLRGDLELLERRMSG